MTTLHDALKSTLQTNWALGVIPEFACLHDLRANEPYPLNAESVIVWLPIKNDRDPLNASYMNVIHRATVRVSTKTSDDRLMEMVDEVRRIIGTNAVTGIHLQFVEREEDISDRRGPIYRCNLYVVMEEHMVSGTSSYSGTTGSGIDHGLLSGLTDDDHTQYLLVNGTRGLSAAWDAGSWQIRAETFQSDVITGTAPFTVASTTLVTNLSADLWDGYQFSDYLNQAVKSSSGPTFASLILNGALTTSSTVDGVDVSAHAADSDIHTSHAAVSIIAGTGMSGGGTIAANRTLNCTITQYTDGLARAACLENDAYGAGWNGDSTHAPTQDAVYDYISTLALDSVVLKKDGSVALTADWDAGGFEIRTLTLEADVTTGTAPLTIASTTKVSNLNVDYVDSVHISSLTNTRLLRYNSTGTQIENATVTESSGALGGITTIGMSGQLTSTLATGTSPFSVASTTVNTNLNADLWDGYQFSDYLDQAVKQASSPTFANVTIGTSIKASGGNAAITIGATGELTKLGQDTPGTNDFLQWDGSKVVWTAGGGGGPGSGTQYYLPYWATTTTLGDSILRQNSGATCLYTAQRFAVGHEIGSVGYTRAEIYGTDSSSTAAAQTFVGSGDTYPHMQILCYAHDSHQIAFDSYYDGTWRSSDVGSNFRIYKAGDVFRIDGDTGIAAGSALTWDALFSLAPTGTLTIGGSLIWNNLTTAQYALGHAAGWTTTGSLLYANLSGNHLVSESTLIEGYLLDLLCYGSGNAAWINCPYEGASVVTQDQVSTTGYIASPSAAASYTFSVPLPTTKGSLKLYISGTRVNLGDADASNYVTSTVIRRYSSDGTDAALDTDATDKNSVGTHEDTSMGALDCSTYALIKVILASAYAGANLLDINGVTVQYYYAI